MIKSELEIEQDVYDLLKNELKGMISGEVYKSGCRPTDAMTEDAVIKVSDAKMIDVKTHTPIINISIICLRIYLSSSVTFPENSFSLTSVSINIMIIEKN